MKNLLTILSLFSLTLLFSQHQVGKKVQKLTAENTFFKPFLLLEETSKPNTNDTDKIVSNATFASIKTEMVNEIVANQYETIEIEIPYNGSLLKIDLYKVNDLFAEGFHVDTNAKNNVEYNKGVYYRGILKDDYTSIASFSFYKNEFNGIISNSQFSNIVIGKLNKLSNTTEYIVYQDQNLKVVNDFICATKDLDYQKTESSHQSNKEINSAKCVSMYFEIDYDLYLNNGSSVTNTMNWMTSVFNNVQALYFNDGISIALKSTYIWTTLDPYEAIGTTSADYLYKFNEVRPVFDGDLGQLVSIETVGLGGVAITVNGLCNQNNFSYSNVTLSYQTVPTYSWTIEVISHELGHLMGSPHTHACVWNGDNTAIDGCGQQAGYAEGSCPTGPIPSTTVKGTIMSYCHLISGVGMNFSNGFGPQPAARILSAMNDSACLSTDCINTCINNITTVNVNNVTSSSALISWIEMGNATSWNVAVYPFGTTGTIPYTTVTSSSFLANDLTPNTYYIIQVKPSCTSGLVAPSRTLMFATAANYCAGITIADTGGITGNYENMQTIIRVMIPEVADNNLTLTFSELGLEQDYDFIYVYNGNTISAPLMNVGGSTGTTIPGPFTSSAVDGSLTLKFFSDQGVTGSGFVASTSCTSNLGIASNGFIDFSYYPNPTNGAVVISSKTKINGISVYNIMGQLLYQSTKNDWNATVDITDFSTGTYFFKLKFDDDKEANFKVLKK